MTGDRLVTGRETLCPDNQVKNMGMKMVATKLPPACLRIRRYPWNAARRTRASGDHQREDAQNEGQRGHDDGSQPQAGAFRAASRIPKPSACFWAANSTIRMAFLEASPINTTRPIWK